MKMKLPEIKKNSMRAKFIYEKFTEDSDPIHDMGIGLEFYRKDAAEFKVEKTLNALKDIQKKIIENLFNENINNVYYLGTISYKQKDAKAFRAQKEVENGKLIKQEETSYTDHNHEDGDILLIQLFETRIGKIGIMHYGGINSDRSHRYIGDLSSAIHIFDLRKKGMNEKFTEDSDPIHDLEIGRKPLIEKWLKEMNIVNYTINDDFTIDSNSFVNLKYKNLTELPEYIQFNKVWKFSIQFNEFKSLRGCPIIVRDLFSCSNNLLTSLEYAPQKAGYFYCHSNPGKFTKEDVLKYCEVPFNSISIKI